MKMFLILAGILFGAGAYLGTSIAGDILRYTEPLRTADGTMPTPVKQQGRLPIAR
jgi:hypothetical protein